MEHVTENITRPYLVQWSMQWTRVSKKSGGMYVQLSSATFCVQSFKVAVSNGMYSIVHLPRLGHTLICH